MTMAGHIWAVLVNLFVILIVGSMFHVARTPFETIKSQPPAS